MTFHLMMVVRLLNESHTFLLIRHGLNGATCIDALGGGILILGGNLQTQAGAKNILKLT